MEGKKQWFPHTQYAFNNPKIIALIDKNGFAGYGRFWALLELLRQQDDYKFDLTAKHADLILCKRLRYKADKLKSFLAEMIEDFGLLQTDGTFIWSDGLIKRMKYWDDRHESLRERGRKGAEARIRSLRAREDNEEEAA